MEQSNVRGQGRDEEPYGHGRLVEAISLAQKALLVSPPLDSGGVCVCAGQNPAQHHHWQVDLWPCWKEDASLARVQIFLIFLEMPDYLGYHSSG